MGRVFCQLTFRFPGLLVLFVVFVFQCFCDVFVAFLVFLVPFWSLFWSPLGSFFGVWRVLQHVVVAACRCCSMLLSQHVLITAYCYCSMSLLQHIFVAACCCCSNSLWQHVVVTACIISLVLVFGNFVLFLLIFHLVSLAYFC